MVPSLLTAEARAETSLTVVVMILETVASTAARRSLPNKLGVGAAKATGARAARANVVRIMMLRENRCKEKEEKCC